MNRLGLAILSAILTGPAPPPDLPPIHRVNIREQCDCKSFVGLYCRWYIFDGSDSGWGPDSTLCSKCLMKSQRRSLKSNSRWVPYLLP